MTDPASLRHLITKWRQWATTDARYGVSQANKSDREYYGPVNAALAVQACADELDAALASAVGRPQLEQEQNDGHQNRQDLRDERSGDGGRREGVGHRRSVPDESGRATGGEVQQRTIQGANLQADGRRPTGSDEVAVALVAGGATPPQHIINLAVEVSGYSPCQSKRGVVIFRGHDVVMNGYNFKPRAFACDGSDECKATCRVRAIHAEQSALLAAGMKASGCDMLHAKSVDGQLVASPDVSCVECSKLALAAGIAGMWIYHATGWHRYETAEWHQLALAAALPRAPRPQPIETAPKDGSKLLLFQRKYGWLVGRWLFDSAATPCWWITNGGWRAEPTHWMPLPVVPVSGLTPAQEPNDEATPQHAQPQEADAHGITTIASASAEVAQADSTDAGRGRAVNADYQRGFENHREVVASPRTGGATPPQEFHSGCTDPNFPQWWQEFGSNLTNKLNDEMLALAAFYAGRLTEKEAAALPRAPRETAHHWRSTQWEITEAMIQLGGGFAAQLGKLLRAADTDNQKRLLVAFPEMFERYDELAVKMVVRKLAGDGVSPVPPADPQEQD